MHGRLSESDQAVHCFKQAISLKPDFAEAYFNLGLEPDDSCLNFHNNIRIINTASYNQIRQPINQTSVARWRHYEKDIQPLLDGLGG